MRRLKRYLWAQIDGKSERYRRCRSCAVLVCVEKPDGQDDPEVLRDHLGHILDEVTSVNLREWARIAWAR